jgi:hypothetical protein
MAAFLHTAGALIEAPNCRSISDRPHIHDVCPQKCRKKLLIVTAMSFDSIVVIKQDASD